MAKSVKDVQDVEVKEQVAANGSAAAAPSTASTPPAFTIQDLQVLSQVVDLACTRGAFRAPEMADVGTLYNKLVEFLKAVASQEKPADPAANS